MTIKKISPKKEEKKLKFSKKQLEIMKIYLCPSIISLLNLTTIANLNLSLIQMKKPKVIFYVPKSVGMSKEKKTANFS